MKINILHSILWAFFYFLMVDIFYLRGYLSDNYSTNDISNFRDKVEEVLFVLAILGSIFWVIYCLKTQKRSLKILFAGIIVSFLTTFWAENIISDYLLYLNTKIKVENHLENYSVIKTEDNFLRVFLFNEKEIITFSEELKKIDKRRHQKGQTSIYEMKDTIHIPYKMGFLGVKFLE